MPRRICVRIGHVICVAVARVNPLADPPRAPRRLAQREQTVTGLVETDRRKIVPAALVEQVQTSLDKPRMTDYHVEAGGMRGDPLFALCERDAGTEDLDLETLQS